MVKFSRGDINLGVVTQLIREELVRVPGPALESLSTGSTSANFEAESGPSVEGNSGPTRRFSLRTMEEELAALNEDSEDIQLMEGLGRFLRSSNGTYVETLW